MEENKGDWCWSSNTLNAIAIGIFIVCYIMLRMTSPPPPFGGVFELSLGLIFLIVLLGVICYCWFDYFEQRKKFKASQRIARTKPL